MEIKRKRLLLGRCKLMELRPTFNRLPVTGYQDNPIADALTQFYDSKLVSVGLQVQNLHTLFNPLT